MRPALVGEDLFSLTVSPLVSQAADCSAGQRILAGTRTGLYGSDNRGQDWRLMSGELGPFPVMATAFSPDYARSSSIFVGGAPGAVLRSLDGGKSWESCSLDYPDVIVTGLVTTPSAYGEGVLLAGTADDGIYRSTTRGRYWETANFGLYDLRVWSLSISPAWQTDQSAYAVVGDGLFRSTNGARAWQPADISDLGDALPQVVAISPNFGRDGTIYLALQRMAYGTRATGEEAGSQRETAREWASTAWRSRQVAPKTTLSTRARPGMEFCIPMIAAEVGRD